MSEPDNVEAMVESLRDRLEWASGPIFEEALRVFEDAIDDLTDAEMTALEATGFAAVAAEGEPSEIRVPSVVRMIRNGRSFDHVEIDPEERPKVMFLGFLAVASEALNGAHTGAQGG